MRCDSPMSYAGSKPALLSTLSASQIEAFIELKELCEKNHRFWSKSTTERNTGPDIDDDVTLLYVRMKRLRKLHNKMCSIDTKKSRRYLRARNYDPQAAFKQYNATASWRETLRLNDTYDNADVSSFEATRRLVTLPQTLFPRIITTSPSNPFPFAVPAMDRPPIKNRRPHFRLRGFGNPPRRPAIDRRARS